ncbi:MAG: hypothetical protein MK213_10310 [Planctomycetes bacterium]|nr:hypothetical protein [Planctomycetota bacterium]
MNPLKVPRIFSLCILASLGWALLSSSMQEPAPESGSALEEPMDVLKRHQRALRRVIADPAQAEQGIALLREMESAVFESMNHCPEPFTEMTAKEQAIWEVGFRRSLLRLATTMVNMELALLEGRMEDAQNLYRELGASKKSGHNDYKED